MDNPFIDENYPDLAEARRQLDLMVKYCVPWHFIKWNRARKAWKVAIRKHRETVARTVNFPEYP